MDRVERGIYSGGNWNDLSRREWKMIPKKSARLLTKVLAELQENTEFDMSKPERVEREIITTIHSALSTTIFPTASNGFIASFLETRGQELASDGPNEISDKLITIAETLKSLARPKPKG